MGLHSIDRNHVYSTSKKVKLVDRKSDVLLAIHDCFMDWNQLYCGFAPMTLREYLERLEHAEQVLRQERLQVENSAIFERLRSQ